MAWLRDRGSSRGAVALALMLGLFVVAPAIAAAQRVERVVDGDTIIVSGVGRVRLIGVDTPESVDPRRPVEFFGKEASAFTRRLVDGQRVRLEYDWEGTDRYGRTLAYVYLPDGTLVNAEIIRRGYGHAYTRFPFKYLERFRQFEREARTAGRGLWGAAPGAERRVASAASDVYKRQGYFHAFDARDGELLWRKTLGGMIANGPISYAVDGRQFVAVAAGNGLFVYALREE